MKVLHVIPSISKVHGGPSLALAMMERSLSAIGIATTTLTTDDDGPGRRLSGLSASRENELAVRHYTRKWSDFYKFSPGLLSWLLRHVREFDVVHIHALFSFSSLAAALLARVNHVPYIVRPLGTLNTYGLNHKRPLLKSVSFRLIESRILAHAAAVHFTSQEELNEAQDLGVPLRAVIIPLGIDGVEALERRGPAIKVQEHKIVLFLSRLDPKKNIEGLLRAFPAVRRQHADALLVIAGDGPAEYVRALQYLAKREGIADAITWVGHVQGERKWDTLTSADVFVLPSFSENFGIAAVEALRAGLPCVLGSGVAIADAIARAGAGVVTAPNSSSIAEALNRLLGDEGLRRNMGARGRELAESEYSSTVMANRLLELYSSIARSGPRSARDPIAALNEQRRRRSK